MSVFYSITTLLVSLYHVHTFTSTVAPTITCSDNLPAPTNGAITYAGGSTNNRPVGATASYSCFGGYTLVGVSVRTCGSDGVWSGSASVCQSKEWLNVYVECVPVPIVICSDLPSLTNGVIDYGGAVSTNSRQVDTVATYTCDTGYTINGSSTRTCESDGMWSGSTPTCQRKWNELCTVCLLSVSSPIQLTALTYPH